ncbi:hypothetical protein LCM08_26490 [Salipiger pacificus]|nr:hypothetical protein [Alloyangia pacifica]
MQHFRVFGSPQNANPTLGQLMSSTAPPEPPIPNKLLSLMEGCTMIVAALLGFTSGIWTFLGANMLEERVGGESFQSVASAGLLGLGASASLVTAWWLLSKVVPKLSSRRLRLRGGLLTVAVLCFGYLVSSLNNSIALTAPSALLMQMEEDRAGLALRVNQTAKRALAIQPYIGQLEARAESFCAGQESELQSGGFTGSSGSGGVSGALGMMCTDARGNAESIAAIVSETQKGLKAVEGTLSDMEAVIYNHDLTIFEREDQFLLLARNVEAWMRDASTADMADALVTSQKAMAAGVASLSTQDGSFGLRQTEVIQGFKSSISEIGDVYQTIADEVSLLPEPDMTPITRMDLPGVTLKFGWQHAPQLAASFGIDTFMLFALAALGLARRENSEDRERTRQTRTESKTEDLS